MAEDQYKKLQEAVRKNQQTLKRVRNLLKNLQAQQEQTAEQLQKVPQSVRVKDM